jgi:hypothetical protein
MRILIGTRDGGGGGLPTLPSGYLFLVDDSGNYITDDDGNFIIVPE